MADFRRTRALLSPDFAIPEEPSEPLSYEPIQDPALGDTAEARQAQGLMDVAKPFIDSGPMPEMGSPEYASGQAEPDIDVTDLVPSKAALAGGAKLAGSGVAKLAAVLKAKGALAGGAPLLAGALKTVKGKLPMDAASRKARAKKMGFDPDKVYYHGTQAKIDSFEPGLKGATTGAKSAKEAYFFSSNPDTAGTYAELGTSNYTKAQKQKIDDYYSRLGSLESEAVSKGHTGFASEIPGYDALEDELRAYEQSLSAGPNIIPTHLKMKNPYVVDFKGQAYRPESYADIIEKAKKGGHDSVVIKNTYDELHNGLISGPKHLTDVVAVFDPSQIRSVHAKFDPSKASSGNISAGIGGAALLGGAAASSQDAKAAEPQEFQSPKQVAENIRKFAEYINNQPISTPKPKIKGTPEYLQKLRSNRKN